MQKNPEKKYISNHAIQMPGAISKTRNIGTPEQRQSGTRNTGALKILNLLKIREKNTGGVELLLK